MKILHIAPDEKFINAIHWQFEEIFPNKSKYLIFLTKKQNELKYIKVSKNVSLVDENLETFFKEIAANDIIILHGLNYFQSKVVLAYQAKAKFIWFFWGGEIYDNPHGLAKQTLGIKTQRKFADPSIALKLKNFIKPVYYYFKKSITPKKSILKAAQKIDYFGSLDKEELNYLKEKGFLKSNILHVRMTYYPLEFILDGIVDDFVKGDSILLGNSASISNNHLEAFDLLKKFNLEKRDLIVPLSYGDNKYAKELKNIGLEVFGKKFMPIIEFMPLSSNKILLGCEIVVMNHYRQQAVGNILAMLWIGAKVYLNESNTFYHYLKINGIIVFSINKDLNPENPTVFRGLVREEILANRIILKRIIGFNTLKKDMERILTQIANEH